MALSEIWEIAKALGPGGAALCLGLWLDERRERRQIQVHVAKLHHDNTRRLERLIRETGKIGRAMAARDSTIVASGRTPRRGGR